MGAQEVEAPRISGQSAHEDGKVVSLTHQDYPWQSYLLEAESP